MDWPNRLPNRCAKRPDAPGAANPVIPAGRSNPSPSPIMSQPIGWTVVPVVSAQVARCATNRCWAEELSRFLLAANARVQREGVLQEKAFVTIQVVDR